MSRLEQRLERLEATASSAAVIEWIVRRIVEVNTRGEVTCASYSGAVFYRHPDETEEQFISRAQSEVMATAPRRPVRLIVSELDLDI
jgi:hypothetical protein